MSFRELIKQRPFFMKCEDAERFSAMHCMVFDHEVANRHSVFAWKESDADYGLKRLAVLEIPPGMYPQDEKVAIVKDYIDSLLSIGVLASRKRKTELSDTESGQLTNALATARNIEQLGDPSIAPISAVMNSSSAVADLWWV